MPQPETNPDPLDALLREEEHYIEDAGFTARVMASLPPRRNSWLRPAILTAATVLGLALLLWCMPQVKDAFQFDANGGISLNLNEATVLTLVVLLVCAGSLAWGMFAMLRWEE